MLIFFNCFINVQLPLLLYNSPPPPLLHPFPFALPSHPSSPIKNHFLLLLFPFLLFFLFHLLFRITTASSTLPAPPPGHSSLPLLLSTLSSSTFTLTFFSPASLHFLPFPIFCFFPPSPSYPSLLPHPSCSSSSSHSPSPPPFPLPHQMRPAITGPTCHLDLLLWKQLLLHLIPWGGVRGAIVVVH